MDKVVKYKDRTHDQLLAEVEKLKRENARLANSIKQEKYGLVWMDNLPEAFDKDSENRLPILKEEKDKAIINDDGKPTHILIEGDNYHALSCLNYTHKEKIDIIYIDPPYNTGSDGFKYKDKRILDKFPDGTEVPVDSPFRHSYWLSFMSKRLEHAKNLLKNTGSIFISIDDNEVAQLRLLCNKIFGEKNFIACLIWQQGKKHIGSFIGVNHEYMLIYAKDRAFINDNANKWRQKKEGLEKIYRKYEELKKEHGNNYDVIREGMIEFYDLLPENEPAKSQEHYNWVDARGIYFAADIAQGTGKGPRYDVIHPVTKKPCVIPTGGWRYKFETMQKLLKEDRVQFGEDESKVPCRKRYLKDTEYELPSSVFYKDGRGATGFVAKIIGSKKFNNPKDVEVLKRILNFKKNEIILDFFAGSGSTAQAVMELNEQDKGNRQWILVTSNEGKIMEEVCYPRLNKIIHGAKLTKTMQYSGLGNSLKYFKTDFVGEHNIKGASDNDKSELAHRAGELLAIAENTLYESSKNKFYQFFSDRPEKKNIRQYTGVYFREELTRFDEFVEKVLSLDKPTTVYIFSWGEGEFDEHFEDGSTILVKPIPQPILEIYKEIYNLG
jgi:adenine-specific DNA-methyltransferase